MSRKNRYIVSYDIVCDKRRRRIAELLGDYGGRVQKSVFECILEKQSLTQLTRKLAGMIDEKEDSILIYLVCNACFQKNIALGLEPVRIDETTEFEII